MKIFYRKAIALYLSMVVMFMIVGTAAAEENVRTGEEYVSPVIGVILQVAITVILAAAIGSSAWVQDSFAPQSTPGTETSLNLEQNYSSVN